MVIVLADVRYKRDQMTHSIVSGLKDRSRYNLNTSTFSETFANGLTWFEYRLLAEQNLDASFGRFQFPDQHPLLLSREQFVDPLIKIDPQKAEVAPFEVPGWVGKAIITIYRKTLEQLCKSGEVREEYGETTKCDVANVQLYNERVTGIGLYVAEAKIQKEPKLLTINDRLDIKRRIVVPEVEQRVIQEAIMLSQNYGIERPDLIAELFKRMMSLTVDVEVMYVLHRQKQISTVLI